MKTFRAVTLAVVVLAATALTGCASNAATPGGTPTAGDATTEPATEAPVNTEGTPTAAWIDGGSGIVVTTWGSGSCVPDALEISAKDGGITATLGLGENAPKACTMDYRARGTYVATPEGIDPTKDVELSLDVEGAPAKVTLAAWTGDVTPNSQAPAAAWTDAGTVALLSWGSSSCRPSVENLEVGDDGLTATFAAATGPCTRDLAPRITLIGAEGVEAGAKLTLVGLDGAAAPTTIEIAGAPA